MRNFVDTWYLLCPWKNEQIYVSFLCVYPVIHHEFHHNIVKVAVDSQGDS